MKKQFDKILHNKNGTTVIIRGLVNYEPDIPVCGDNFIIEQLHYDECPFDCLPKEGSKKFKIYLSDKVAICDDCKINLDLSEFLGIIYQMSKEAATDYFYENTVEKMQDVLALHVNAHSIECLSNPSRMGSSVTSKC